VQARVDAGTVVAAVEPDDGAWGEAGEAFTVTTEALPPGHHVLTLESTTGATKEISRDVWSGPTPALLTLTAGGQAVKTIAYGGKTTLKLTASGSGSPPDGDPLPIPYLDGISVTRGSTLVASATVGRSGTWTRSVAPGRNATYLAVYAPGDDAVQFLGPAEAQARVMVRAALTARRDAGPLRRGLPIVIRGRVRPSNPGRRMLLQRKVTVSGATRWTTVARSRTRADSTYRLAWRPSAAGAVRLRVRFDGSATNVAAVRYLAGFRVR
jgi:hypothetical protein